MIFMSQLFTTYTFCFRIMSAAKNYAASPKKGVSYFAHFPKAFLVPYGKMKEEMLTSKRCLEVVNTINCEWLLRLKYAISEMAETFTANTEVVKEALTEIDFNKIMTKFDQVSELLEIFNTRKNLDKPQRDNVIEVIRHFLTPDEEMEEMIQTVEKLGQAMYLMANYHRVTQTLFTNLEIFADKSQNSDGLDKRFKQEPSVQIFTDYLAQSIVGNEVQAKDMQSRRNLLDAFSRVERRASKRPFPHTEPESSTDTDPELEEQTTKKRKRKGKQVLETSSEPSSSEEDKIIRKDGGRKATKVKSPKKSSLLPTDTKKDKKGKHKEEKEETRAHKSHEKKRKRKPIHETSSDTSLSEEDKDKSKVAEQLEQKKGKSPRKKASEQSTPKKKDKGQVQLGEEEELKKSKGNKKKMDKPSTPKKN